MKTYHIEQLQQVQRESIKVINVVMALTLNKVGMGLRVDCKHTVSILLCYKFKWLCQFAGLCCTIIIIGTTISYWDSSIVKFQINPNRTNYWFCWDWFGILWYYYLNNFCCRYWAMMWILTNIWQVNDILHNQSWKYNIFSLVLSEDLW